MGGLSALAQIVMAAMISPRERGRYSGYLGATFAVATVGGPLLGGVITDTDWLGWRWCFYVGVPFAIIALIVLQKTLKLPVIKREGVKVDWAGAFFISAAVSLLLVWVTLAGDKYDWMSWQTAAMVGGAVVLGAIFVFVESKAKEPIIPLRLFRNKTITLASLASLFVGIAMFSGTVFFSQYFQLARDKSPTMSGVMTIPMIGGLFISSTVSGQIITKTGKWKAWLVAGGVLVTAGLGLLGTIRYDTEYWHIAIFMALMGLGIGMMMQNLVLCTQNQVAPEDLGSASSVVTFFRSLGGAVGVSALGAVLANRVTHYVKDGLTELGPKGAQAAAKAGSSGGGIPDLDSLPAPIRTVMESAYGHGVADVFLYAAPCALLAFLFTLFIKEVALKTRGGLAQSASDEDGAGTPAAAPASAAAAQAEEREPALVGAPSLGSDPSDSDGRTPSWAQPATAAATQPLAAFASAGGDTTPAGSAIHGFVRNAEGNPVPRSAVTLISLGGRQLGRSVAQANGSYVLNAPGAGSYVLIAAADGHQPQASTVVVGDEPYGYDILLSGTSGLGGQVRSAVTGEPVDGAMVVVTDVRGEVIATGKTGEQGHFTFDELTTGTFTVAVNAAELPADRTAGRGRRPGHDPDRGRAAVRRAGAGHRAGGQPERRPPPAARRPGDAGGRGGQRRGHLDHRRGRRVRLHRPRRRRLHGHRERLPAGRQRPCGRRTRGRRLRRRARPPRGLTRPRVHHPGCETPGTGRALSGDAPRARTPGLRRRLCAQAGDGLHAAVRSPTFPRAPDTSREHGDPIRQQRER